MHDRVHLLGIRHHGPGSARSVLAALERLQPCAVLVEAPADVESGLGWIGERGLEPPVALLGWVVAEPSRFAVAPFAEFSPEWQAIAWAGRIGVEREVAITGGLALNRALAAELESRLAVPLLIPPEPRIVGALGAALVGASAAR